MQRRRSMDWRGRDRVAGAGKATLALTARPELLNHAGALHAGVQAALIDTACGYAAGTLARNVVKLQLNLQFPSSAKGDRFEARARLIKAAKAQLLAAAELIAWQGGAEVLAANASAVLARVGEYRATKATALLWMIKNLYAA